MPPLRLRRGKEINSELTKYFKKLNWNKENEEEPGGRDILGEPLEKGRRTPSALRAGGRDYRLIANIGSQITC